MGLVNFHLTNDTIFFWMVNMKSIQLSSIKKKIGADNFTVIRDTIFKYSFDKPSKGMTLQRDRVVNSISDPQVKKSLENLTTNVDWFVIDVV